MSNVIISDTGPLIALSKIELLVELKTLFGKVLVPNAVFEEATFDVSKPGAIAVKEAFDRNIISVRRVEMDETLKESLAVLDLGETKALSLA